MPRRRGRIRPPSSSCRAAYSSLIDSLALQRERERHTHHRQPEAVREAVGGGLFKVKLHRSVQRKGAVSTNCWYTKRWCENGTQQREPIRVSKAASLLTESAEPQVHAVINVISSTSACCFYLIKLLILAGPFRLHVEPPSQSPTLQNFICSVPVASPALGITLSLGGEATLPTLKAYRTCTRYS